MENSWVAKKIPEKIVIKKGKNSKKNPKKWRKKNMTLLRVKYTKNIHKKSVLIFYIFS